MTKAMATQVPDCELPSGKPAAGGDDGFETVHARPLRHFPRLVDELGGNVERLVAAAGIGREAIDHDFRGVTYRQLAALLELAAEQIGCPDFGMRLAQVQGADMFGPMGAAMRRSRTFGEALGYVARHTYAHSLAARIWTRSQPEDDLLFIGHDILIAGLPRRVQAMEQVMLSGHLGAVELTGGRARVRRVHFRHQPVSPQRVYHRYFGCDVLFGMDEDGVFFSQADLATRVAEPDAWAQARITAWIDQTFTRHRPPFHAEVRGIVMQRLAGGDCANASVAAELGLHPRTLNRRLHAEGTSFQKVKDEVRRDIMLYCLEQTALDLTCISEKLGFAEQSVMTRTCRRWFAESPSAIRRRAKGAAADKNNP